MNKFDKKRLNKMYEKIDSIAGQGKLGFVEYKEYLDEIVSDGQFWIFQNLLSRKYGFTGSGSVSLVDAKTESVYDRIRVQTNSPFQKELKKLYDTSICYQIGKKVYSATSSVFLGEIYQQAALGNTQSFQYDSVVAVKSNEVRTYDNVDVALIDKYKTAILFLTS